MRSRVIQSLHKSDGSNITQACELLRYSKQAYYKSLVREEKEAFQTDILIDLIRKKRSLWKKAVEKIY